MRPMCGSPSSGWVSLASAATIRPTSGCGRTAIPGSSSTSCWTRRAWSARRVPDSGVAANATSASAPSTATRTFSRPCSASRVSCRRNRHPASLVEDYVMPMPSGFRERLLPLLSGIAARFGTPFHVYDEAGIRRTGEALKQAFAGVPGFREYYAVKALPNPAILRIMQEMGFGFDCSSVAELVLARQLGARGDDIMFTSNNTSQEEFAAAL